MLLITNTFQVSFFYVMCWPKFDEDVNALIQVLTERLLTKTQKTKKNTATVQMEFHISILVVTRAE